MGEEHLAYAGMDDAGEMSAWYVFNAIGLYTYSPADPEYIVTVPLFPKVTFVPAINDVPFTVRREGNGRRITSVSVGGKALKGWFVPHTALAKGADVVIQTQE